MVIEETSQPGTSRQVDIEYIHVDDDEDEEEEEMTPEMKEFYRISMEHRRERKVVRLMVTS